VLDKEDEQELCLKCFNFLGDNNVIQLVSFIIEATFRRAVVVRMSDRRMTYTNDSPG